MQRAKWLSMVLGLLLVLALALGASAQDSTEEAPEATATPEVTVDEVVVDVTTIIPEDGAGLLTTLQGTQFVTGFQGAVPLNASVLGVAYLTGFDTYSFDLSTVRGLGMGTTVIQPEATADPGMSAFADCGLVRVYKVSSQGAQDIWPNVNCTGTTLSITAGGDGHYILYVFSSANALVNAPETLSTCIGAFDNEATPEAEATPESEAVVLGEDQICWNFSAITGVTTSGTVVATASAPVPATTDSSDDDDDTPESTAEATVEATEEP